MADNYSFWDNVRPSFNKHRSNIDSTRNYDIDGRTYHNTSNESRNRSQVAASRSYDIDGRNYSNAMHNTGGAKIFSFKGGGGALGTGVLTNVLMWLVIFGIVLFVWLTVWPLIKKARGFISPDEDTANTKADEEISKQRQEVIKHMSDRMDNGNTYTDAATWLSSALHRKWLDIFKDVDEISVGNFMLTVKKEEWTQLSNSYREYRNSVTSWYENWSSGSHSLEDDLKGVFSSDEKKKYLGHLNLS